MPLINSNFAPLIITSSGSTLTNAIWPLDDAQSVCVVIASSPANAASTYNIQLSLYDPRTSYTVGSSRFYTLAQPLSTPVALAPGQAYIIQLPAAQQLRILCSGGETSGHVVGWAAREMYI